ncbi:MAG: DUF1700 domain-containing protein [Candidatus Kapaibacterium sp.]|nr:MAG: DUF1700 domain-containing protein [Candidatus Kapabacteria bacterium]
MQPFSFSISSLGTPFLSDHLAKRIWKEYQSRIERVLEPLPLLQREEILLEIQSHIWESVQRDTASSEAEKVLNAAQKLGHPEIYLHPLVGTKLFEQAAHSFNPSIIAKSLYYMIGGSRLQSLLVLVMSILYTLLFFLATMVCTKIIFPKNVGLFASEQGTFSFGYIIQTEPYSDVLGFWFIPLGLLVCGLLYMLITKIAYRIVKTILKTSEG